ncbi:hypothetical protein BGW80DRAFT_848979 [Lactifluus volemus]|nr:hypothetical protein BGW80DRAFT_848979 [Lactifluus volemus]
MYHATAQVHMHAYGPTAICLHIRLTALPFLFPVPATVCPIVFPLTIAHQLHSHGQICHNAYVLPLILRPRCRWLAMLLASLHFYLYYMFSLRIFCLFLLCSEVTFKLMSSFTKLGQFDIVNLVIPLQSSPPFLTWT